MENNISIFTLKFRNRNLTSANNCETLSVLVTFSIPWVPLFRRGLVQPHNTDTSSRLRSSAATQGQYTPFSPSFYIHVKSLNSFLLHFYIALTILKS